MQMTDDNHIRATAWLLSGLCAFSGTILYILTVGSEVGAIASVVWGSVYGFGYLVLSTFLAPKPGFGGFIYFVFGTFVWPVMATVGVAIIANSLLDRYSRRQVITLFIASNLIVFPLRYAKATPVYYLPIYGVFLGDF